MTDAPGYEEFSIADGVVRIDRHALDVGIELVDGDPDEDLAFVGRACSVEDLDREKVLLAYALLDDITPRDAVPESAPEHSAPGIGFAKDKLRSPLLDILTQKDNEMQLRLVVDWFNRAVAGTSVNGFGPMDEFEEFADYMRDRAGVNIARTIHEHEDQLDGLGLDISEEMAKRWDPVSESEEAESTTA